MRKIAFFLIFLTAIAASAKKPVLVTKASSEAITVDSIWDNNENRTHALIAPFKEALEVQMEVIIGKAIEDMPASDPNGKLANWCAQVQVDKASQVLNRPIDLGVVNIGGLRCDIPKGPITLARIYELMPFDNELVVVVMPGTAVLELFDSFHEQGGQGAKWQHGMTEEKIDPKGTYSVATSDYLAEGNDHMEAFRKGQVIRTGLKLRDIYILAVKEQKNI